MCVSVFVVCSSVLRPCTCLGFLVVVPRMMVVRMSVRMSPTQRKPRPRMKLGQPSRPQDEHVGILDWSSTKVLCNWTGCRLMIGASELVRPLRELLGDHMRAVKDRDLTIQMNVDFSMGRLQSVMLRMVQVFGSSEMVAKIGVGKDGVSGSLNKPDLIAKRLGHFFVEVMAEKSLTALSWTETPPMIFAGYLSPREGERHATARKVRTLAKNLDLLDAEAKRHAGCADLLRSLEWPGLSWCREVLSRL